MSLLYCDTETWSSVPLTRGLDQYLTGAECLIVTYAFDDAPVQYWDVTADSKVPSDLHQWLTDSEVTVCMHNATFDWHILQLMGYEIPLERCFCTMACSYAHSLPGSLETLGMVLGLPTEMRKFIRGKELIKIFCSTPKGQIRKTSKTNPEDWQEFLDYAVQDTATLREVYKRLPKHNYKGDHHELWVADFEINQRGFKIDQDLCRAAVKIKEQMEAQNSAEIAELTNGVITKGTQRERIINYIVGERGFLMLNLTSETIERVLKEEDLDDITRRLLELRRDSSMSSLAKYERALEKVGPDGRMRHTLQFSGADRTGRWAGRGFQPHNMPRPKRKVEEIENEIIPAILDGTLPQKVDDMNQACKDALRGVIIPESGNEFIVGDWSNIEGRCTAWEANEEWKLDAFRAFDAGVGPDLYKLLYTEMFGVDLDDVTSYLRQQGKAFELAFGYGGGVGAAVTAVTTYGVDLKALAPVMHEAATNKIYNKAEANWKRAFIRGEDSRLEPEIYIGCDIAKQIYRKTNPKIMQLWWDTERACRWAIERPGSVHYVGKCKIWRTPAFLIIELPSGRRLLYAEPRVKQVIEYDEETEEITARSSIRYKASKKKQWWTDRTYGGKVVENYTQAIANDVLRAFLLRCRANGWPIVLHVHDEGVMETPIGFFSLDDFIEEMEKPLWWTDGLPMKAAGYVSTRYRKG